MRLSSERFFTYEGASSLTQEKEIPASSTTTPLSGLKSFMNFSRGLACLETLNLILLQECGDEWAHKSDVKLGEKHLKILNRQGEKLFYATQSSGLCKRNVCGFLRPVKVEIYDAANHALLMKFRRRRVAWDSWLCPWAMQFIAVLDESDTIMGYIKQESSLFRGKFTIRPFETKRLPALVITGPPCTLRVCGRDAEFVIRSVQQESSEVSSTRLREVGTISKKWSSYIREIFSDPDYVGITVPEDLSVEYKAMLIATTIVLNEMYFES